MESTSEGNTLIGSDGLAAGDAAGDSQTPLSSPLHRACAIFLAENVVFSKVDQELARIARKAKRPGFRPGKVPRDMIRKQYHQDVLNDVLRAEFHAQLDSYISSSAWFLNRLLSVDLSSYAPGEGWHFSAVVEIFPEFAFDDWARVDVVSYACEVHSGDIDSAIGRLRRGMATLVASDQPAAESDYVTVDGTVSFVVADGDAGSAVTSTDPVKTRTKKFSETLFIKELPGDLQLHFMGARAGSTLSFDWVIPVAWQGVPADTAVHYDLVVQAVQSAVLPEVDRRFFEQLGFSMQQSEVDMREEISEILSFHAQKVLLQWTELSFFIGLMEKMAFTVPPSITQSVRANYWAYVRQNYFSARRFGAMSTPDAVDENFVHYLSFRESLMALLVRQESFTFTEEEFKDEVMREMKFSANSRSAFKDRKKLSILHNSVRSSLLIKKLIAWLTARCHVSKHLFDFDELLRIESSGEADLSFRARVTDVLSRGSVV